MIQPPEPDRGSQRAIGRPELAGTHGLRLAAVVANHQAGVLVEDENRTVVMANRNLVRLFSIPVEAAELVGTNCRDALEQVALLFRDSSGFSRRIDELVAGREPSQPEQLELLDGRVFQREYVPIIDPHGRSHGHIWIYRDESHRRAAERAVRTSEKRKTAMLETALDAIISIDASGHIVDFNPAAEVTFGFKAEEALGKKMADLIMPERYREAHEAGFQRFLQTGDGPILGKRIELDAIRKNGEEFPIECAIHSIDLEDSKIFTAYIRDISVRKESEAKLREAMEKAADSARTKERFLANMSHEMRTPLNAVIGMTTLLQHTSLDAQQKSYLEAVKLSADNLLALINDLLDIAKIESGKLSLNYVPMAPAQIVRDAITALSYHAEQKGLKLKLFVDDTLPGKVIGDPARFNQILTNLLSNAIKFTSTGGVTVTLETLDDSEKTSTIALSVVDTGIGIPEDKQKLIFESFGQVASEAVQNVGGTGLGLAIVSELVEMQGGTVTVDSTEGVGTSFKVVLPFRAYSGPVSTAADDPVLEKHLNLHGRRVLVVEDNEMNRLVVGDLLRLWGAEVDFAHDGLEAVNQVNHIRYDVVLMDMRMPNMDGRDATIRIRKQLGISSAQLPIIALTASTLEDDRDELMEIGMDDFLMKPFDPAVLARTISLFLDDRVDDYPGDSAQSSRPINWDLVDKNTNGNEDLKQRMIETFIRTIREARTKMERALLADDWESVAFAAHKNRSSAAILGASSLAALLERLCKKSALENDPSYARESVAEAVELIGRVVTELEAYNE
ncbi:MAG: ATP-binding protein [Rhodothermales bacterium]